MKTRSMNVSAQKCQDFGDGQQVVNGFGHVRHSFHWCMQPRGSTRHDPLRPHGPTAKHSRVRTTTMVWRIPGLANR